MIVDDSAVVRGLVTRMLESDPSIEIVASVGNGLQAVQSLDRHNVEVVVLDIEMPVMDGLTALPKLLEKDPGLQIIMASTLTLQNADISLRALEAGAADYIPKPTTSRELAGTADFKRDLLEKVRALGGVRRSNTRRAPHRFPSAPPPPQRVREPLARPVPGPIVLCKPGEDVPEIIAIGSSTGGPQAL
ncbi:MAG: response regulator, partial [Alphaproteobacteria bacterium]|nr:response regulator [Alphaproteobacteria bacterium]